MINTNKPTPSTVNKPKTTVVTSVVAVGGNKIAKKTDQPAKKPDPLPVPDEIKSLEVRKRLDANPTKWVEKNVDYSRVKDSHSLHEFVHYMQNGVTGILNTLQYNVGPGNKINLPTKVIQPWHDKNTKDTRMHFTVEIKEKPQMVIATQDNSKEESKEETKEQEPKPSKDGGPVMVQKASNWTSNLHVYTTGESQSITFEGKNIKYINVQAKTTFDRTAC